MKFAYLKDSQGSFFSTAAKRLDLKKEVIKIYFFVSSCANLTKGRFDKNNSMIWDKNVYPESGGYSDPG